MVALLEALSLSVSKVESWCLCRLYALGPVSCKSQPCRLFWAIMYVASLLLPWPPWKIARNARPWRVLIRQFSSYVGRALPEAKYVHFHMVAGGLDRDLFLSNMIMRVYDKCESLKEARALFNCMRIRNIVSWNMIIGAYTTRNLIESAFILLCDMIKERRIEPDKVTCITLLSACKNSLSFVDIHLLHVLVFELEVDDDVTVGNVLVNAYGRQGALAEAINIFERMHTRNTVSWNTLIAACAIRSFGSLALDLFQRMHLCDMVRDKASFISILNACEGLPSVLQGMLVHFEIVEAGLDTDIMVVTTLVKMYAGCKSLADSVCVFQSVLSKRDAYCWTVMIAAYIQCGYSKRAFQLFQEMLQEKIKPSNATFVTLLSACTNSGALHDGRMVRSCISNGEINSDIILANALLTMYQKCGGFLEAEELFFNMPKRDVISYTSMIATYAEQGRGYEALFLFVKMRQLGIAVDVYIFSSVLDACASVAALIEGRILHHEIVENGLEWDAIVGNALVSLYGECGIAEDAYEAFIKLTEQDWISWSSIIDAYGNQGHISKAFKLFWEMQRQGLQPTVITFVSILAACSHAGLLHEGLCYFISMPKHYVLIPSSEHYMYMIDLIGRAGCINDAQRFIDGMPMQPSVILWNTLLGACKVHGFVEVGHLAAKYVFEMNPVVEAAHLALSNLYASVGRFEEAMAARKDWETLNAF
ncbi:hypothetical protein KP509_34G015700 [Ceratopteris richardii]|uniref:Pentatricopeptide repeat-containing protein n=1 Tax=Ceratopteris richardii TaxID=49495 RepID=A0A8T2QHH6_CERRI|nr:hypothetical protein KP509_34G015700 [Ceratopteris richardii]